MKSVRPILWILALASPAMVSSAAHATNPSRAGGSVGVHILVLEAERGRGGPKKAIDVRLSKVGLARKLQQLGYARARVLDELKARVERGARVTLEMPSRRQNLQVKLLQARPARKQYRLELAVPEERFRMTTNHQDGGTVLIFLPARRSRPDIGLAVTPRR